MNLPLRPLLGVALVSCAAGAFAQQTLTVASFPSFDEHVKAAIPLFKKVRPDVEIKLVSLQFGDYHNAMTTALATGQNLPDVMGIEIGFVGKFAESGGLEDLAKPPYNALQYRDQFFKFTFPQAMNKGGGLAAMPADVGPGALFYRKDLLDKAGVTEAQVTQSWESFIEAGKQVKAKTGAYMIPHANALMGIYIRSNLKDGEGVYFGKNNTVLVNTPRFEKAFQLAKQARVAGIDGRVTAWTNEWAESFKRGSVATEMMGGWLAGHLANWLAPDTKGQWRSANLPNGAYAAWGGSFYAIPKKIGDDKKKLAWEFIKFMTLNKEMQIEALRKVDSFPSLIAATTDPFIDQPIEFLGGQKARQQWRTSATKIPAIEVHKLDPIANEVITAELDKVLQQNKDIKKALADAQQAIQRRIR
ncbi:ABC transporter substrate-binding protein [Caldimonas brevitalea]|uniref:Sugar ABC transporter substrate-binding protein n=1 Tax=Caldimonas brevitalea TaxID=413882 RepID=A0A0G3BVJ7_9BURK|nr:extracellular solute-binding protein [Caldimonas brevitalea]AKJ32053.1 sugar ABC transporter substrate-binding protein [Caldimonas brevitalea]